MTSAGPLAVGPRHALDLTPHLGCNTMTIRIRQETKSLRELSRVAYVHGETAAVSAWRLGAVIVLALVFSPVSLFVAYASIHSPFFVDRLRRFVRPGESDQDASWSLPRNLETIAFIAESGLWIRPSDSELPGVLLLRTADGDECVILGMDWPGLLDDESEAYRNWRIFRQTEQSAPVAVRAWGRCATGTQFVAERLISPFRNRVNIIDKHVYHSLVEAAQRWDDEGRD